MVVAVYDWDGLHRATGNPADAAYADRLGTAVTDNPDLVSREPVPGVTELEARVAALEATSTAGAASLVVAAANSDERLKDRADYVCAGTDDQDTINDAAVSLGSYGGVVSLVAGAYVCPAPVIIDQDYVTLSGPGFGPSAVIHPVAGVTKEAGVIVGDSRTVQVCEVNNVTVKGTDTAGTLCPESGHGVVFRSNGGVLNQVRVQSVAGDGFRIEPKTGPLWEVFATNCMSIRADSDDWRIGDGVFNSEFLRCVALGGEPEGRGRYGFYNQGEDVKFLLSHAYFTSGNGMHCDKVGTSVSIIGGEYETCGGSGIHLQGLEGATIYGVDLYGNADKDLLLAFCRDTRVTDVTARSPVGDNLYLIDSPRTKIAGALLQNASDASIHLVGDVAGTRITNSTSINLRGPNSILVEGSLSGVDIVGSWLEGNVVEVPG